MSGTVRDEASPDGLVRDARSGTLERGLAILEFLSQRDSVSAGEIVQALELSRSATYRILGILRAAGFIEEDPASSAIKLSSKAALMGLAAIASYDPLSEGRRQLAELSKELGEAALMAIRDGDDMVYIAHENETEHSVGVRLLLGVRRPMYATSLGKAYLASLSRQAADVIIDRTQMQAFTPTTITDRGSLRTELELIRDRGYSIDNGEHEPDVMCFGAPIRDADGSPTCAISVAGPRARMLLKSEQASRRVAEVALAISRRLGYPGAAIFTPMARRER